MNCAAAAVAGVVMSPINRQVEHWAIALRS
jgi:hypothetical protein